MKESIFQAQMIASGQKVGAIILNVHGGGMQANGWPDLQVNHPWWFGYLELKNETGKLTKLQIARIKRLLNVGTWAFVARPGLRANHIIFEDVDGKLICHNGEGEHWLETLKTYCERFSVE